jgi:hypothetical protein
MAELWEYCQGAGSVIEQMVEQRVRDIASLLVDEGIVKGLRPQQIITILYHANIDNIQFSKEDNSTHYEEHDTIEPDDLILAGIS